MQRVAVLLLDSAERALVETLADDGVLPTLASLRAKGALVPLRTPTLYRAEYACTEFLTGQPADAVRYWSTVDFDPTTYGVRTIGSARRMPFYGDGPAGPVVTFDVPHSVIVDGLPGAQVVGWGGHDARFQHPRSSLPAGLMAEIDARFGTDPSTAVEYRGSWHQPWYLDALADALVAAARRRADIVAWLLDRHPDWALLLVGMTEVHAAGHNAAHGLDPDHLLGTHPTAAVARPMASSNATTTREPVTPSRHPCDGHATSAPARRSSTRCYAPGPTTHSPSTARAPISSSPGACRRMRSSIRTAASAPPAR